MNDAQFRDAVAAEVRGEAEPGVPSLLREPENVRRWKAELVALKLAVEEQFAQRKARMDEVHLDCMRRGEGAKQEYFAAKREYEAWKASAGQFKRAVEARLREVRATLQVEAQGNQSSRAALWRLVDGAEQLIPREHPWHRDLAALRDLVGGGER